MSTEYSQRLHDAADIDDVATLKKLLDACRQKGFALTCACYRGHPDEVWILLDAGADKVVQETPRWHGLHAACGWGKYPKLETVKLLLEYGADAKRGFEGRTPVRMRRMRDKLKLSRI